jgi:hypothetical protein
MYMNNNDGRKKYTEEVNLLYDVPNLQEILLHALDLNGVQDLERLDVYIKDDIERYGTKLEDCHRRLKRFLAELLVLLFMFLANLSALHFKREKTEQISSTTRMKVLSVEISQRNWVKISSVSGN